MKIIRAKTLGVCMGVRRALDLVERAVDENPGIRVATIGPLIHNVRVLEELSEKGINIINSPEEAEGGVAVIRAHGIGKKEKEAYIAKGLEILDGTCTRVMKSQELAAARASEGFHVLLAGDPGHGEVLAIAGSAEGCRVISSAGDARELELEGDIFILCQTTFREDEYDRVLSVLEEKAEAGGFKLEVAHTVCPATVIRQNALKELAEDVEAILVVGGKTSANTTRLYQIAVESGKPSWHVEGADQVPEEIGRFNVVGVTAGASAPDWIIEEIEERVRQLSEGE